MISKSKLKELSAYRQQRRCDEEAVFVVEGPKMAAEAMASAFAVRVVCATAEWLATNSVPSGIEVLEVGQAELERLSLMKSPNAVWMLVERAAVPVVQPQGAGELVLALEHLQDPGNMGTIMRTADWYGIRRIVCSADTVSCYNPKVVQASMGAVFRTAVEYTDLGAWLSTCGMPVYAASLQGTPLQQTAAPATPAVLLIGNESRGLSERALGLATHTVSIPNRGGTAESLNAAVAAAILINHFCI